jgi:hypothetical protein
MFSQLKTTNSLILITLLIIGAVLRLWNFTELPLMHDELSALSRLEYKSFEDFLYYGIQIDGHPAGIQLFLYYFTYIFGYNTVILKLPFILSGIASIYLTYKIGKKWFSETTGLISAALLVGIQYTIIYSDIIRPYAPGLFLSLLLVNIWSDIFILKKTNRLRFIAFGITIAATAYTHYFTLLFSLIVSITGLCLVNKKILLKYISSGLLAFLLFTPHLSIFFYQLEVGGVGIGTGGWLKAPDLKFLIDYLFYIFNYSFIYLTLGISLFVLSIITFKNNKEGIPKRLILLIWFVTPIAIGFWYSININPVLQFSVLLFSLPFFFIFLNGFERERKAWFNILIPASIITIAIISLQTQRHHYTAFYKQPVGSFYDLTKTYHNDSTLLIGRHEICFIDHYNKLNNNNFKYFTTDEDSTSVAQFQELLKNPKFKQVITGSLSPEKLGLAIQYFPNIIQHEQGINLENTVLRRGNPNSSLYYKDFELGTPSWKDRDLKQTETGYYLNSTWGLSRVFSLDTLLNSEYDIIEFYADIETSSNDSNRLFLLVMEFKNGDKKVKWTASSSQISTKSNNLNFKMVNAQHIFGIDGEIPKTLKAYIWNKSKSEILIKKIGLRVRKGNPNEYALFNKYQ